MKQAQLQAVNPVLPSRDVRASIDFYVTRLGFSLQFQDATDDPRYVGLRRDDVELHVQWHDPAEWEVVERPALRFAVPDMEALFEEYKNKDVFHEKTKIRETTWGTREFAFYDPDQNGLTFYCDNESQTADDTDDFAEFVQHMRSQGATEKAFDALWQVADMLVGNIVLTFPYHEEAKQYSNQYSSPTFPEPGLSDKDREAYYEGLAAKCEPVYPSLKQLADMDQSGFISTEEGLDFHQAFECGLKVAYLAEKEGPDLDILAHLVHVDRQACEQYLMRYQAIVDALPEYVGTSLSPLPDAVKDQLSLVRGV